MSLSQHLRLVDRSSDKFKTSLQKIYKNKMTPLILFPFSIWTKYSTKIVGQVFNQVGLNSFWPVFCT